MPDVLSTSVTLMIEDLDASVRFYTERLGFEIEYRADPHFAMVGCRGLRVGLHPRGDHPSAGACNGVSIGLQVADIRASVAELSGHGIEFPQGVTVDGPLLRADFSDPDGTAMYLVELKG